MGATNWCDFPAAQRLGRRHHPGIRALQSRVQSRAAGELPDRQEWQGDRDAVGLDAIDPTKVVVACQAKKLGR